MLTQCFGDQENEEPVEADGITAIKFDHTGTHLATGDRGGRVVIFKAQEPSKSDDSAHPSPQVKYRYYKQFQSHEAEFDNLKSLEIEEKINQIKWCRPCNNSLLLLSTNDRTVKLWKVRERKVRQIGRMGGGDGTSSSASPSVSSAAMTQPPVVSATPRRVFSNAHAYMINAISVNSDGETFISSDDLRINWWNLEINDRSFNIVDIKPQHMNELTEVISGAEFHPQHCHVMMYSTSRGTCKIADTRQSALCDTCQKVLEDTEDTSPKNFFSEIIASVSDAHFTQDGRYVISRDYLTVKVWDLNMESRPVKTVNVHEHLRPRLCDLYESDCIFDKFEVAVSPSGHQYATGSYSNMFHVYDRTARSDMCIELSKNANESSSPTHQHTGRAAGGRSSSIRSSRRRDHDGAPGFDFHKKVLHLDWHPTRDMVAVAGLSKLYLYSI